MQQQLYSSGASITTPLLEYQLKPQILKTVFECYLHMLWYVVTTNILAMMLAQAHTVLGFLKTICDVLKSEFTVSLKRKLVLFFWGVHFFSPVKFKIFLPS